MPHSAMLSSLLLLKADINAFLSLPLWSQSSNSYAYSPNSPYSASSSTINRRFLLRCSVIEGGSGRSLLDNFQLVEEVAAQRKYDKKNNYNSKIFSFQRVSGTTSTDLWEHKLRTAIVTKNWKGAYKLLKEVNSTRLSTGRDVVYVITETSRRNNNISAIIPLLSSMTNLEEGFDHTTENDVMPLLSDCSKMNSISVGYRIVSWLHTRKVQFSARTYSVLIKGLPK
jgi:hypothetical protein